MPKLSISVVIPLYNAAGLILDALESVNKQVRQPDEIIVVDDGSTDGGEEIAAAWGKANFDNFKLISKSNGGSGSARNAGIRIAQGEIVALLDADDLLRPHHLQAFEGLFNRAPDALLCFSDAVRERDGEHDKEGFLSRNALLSLESEAIDGGGRRILASAYLALIGGSRIATCSCVFRRDAAIRCGLFNETLEISEDREFLLRMSRLGEFAYSTEQLSIVRIHGANKTSLDRGAERRGRVKMLKTVVGNMENMALNDEEREVTRKAFNAAIATSNYWTSREGMVAYMSWQSELRRGGSAFARSGWWGYARAAIWSVVHWSRNIVREKSAVSSN